MIDFLSSPRRRKKKAPQLLLFLILVGLTPWVYYHYVTTVPNSKEAAVLAFTVEPGWGSQDIGRQLKQAQLIRSNLIFQLYVWQRGIASTLQTGQYFLAKNLSVKQVADILSRGSGETHEVSLTFIEGWNNRDLAVYLESQGFGSQKEFFDVTQKRADWWDAYDILASKPRNLDLEGYLFPDTYRVFRDAELTDIIKKMLDNLQTKITPKMLADITASGKTIHEVLTLASIIEKEVPGDADRKLVADIFNKRLVAGMALQADSTVNYATGKSTPRASAADLAVESLYNTYKYQGLPPGPIANPSLSAITAAIYPTPNDYWYFLTKPDGGVIYNTTFAGHVEDKNRYY